MSDLNKMPNIGKVLAKNLEQAGIGCAQELEKHGSKSAFLRIRLNDPDACLNQLFALEGAVQGIRWHNLTPEKKDELKLFFNSL